MDELRELKLYYEQEAYNEIRVALQEDYLNDPQKFMEHFNKRPEDLSGSQLRDYYPHFLVQQRELRSKHAGFRKRFLAGDLFGETITLSRVQKMAVCGCGNLCTA